MPLINFGSDKDGANTDARTQAINNYVASIKNIERHFLPKVILIAAIDNNLCIAHKQKDKLNWVPKKDKLWYREFTIQLKNLIIGKNTFDLLPEKAKEHRIFWVFTKTIPFGTIKQINKTTYFVNMRALDFLKKHQNILHFGLVGGSQIFSLFAQENLISTLYLTIIKANKKSQIASCIKLFKNLSDSNIYLNVVNSIITLPDTQKLTQGTIKNCTYKVVENNKSYIRLKINCN